MPNKKPNFEELDKKLKKYDWTLMKHRGKYTFELWNKSVCYDDCEAKTPSGILKKICKLLEKL